MSIYLSINHQLTACESACNWSDCKVCCNSKYLCSYHPLKLDDLKNLLYSPSKSPLHGEVNCGPDCSIVARKSSCLNWLGLGGAWNIKKIPKNIEKITKDAKDIKKITKDTKEYLKDIKRYQRYQKIPRNIKKITKDTKSIKILP